MPERIQLSRRKGWRKPENTVVVARPSKWGNPVRVDGKRVLIDVGRHAFEAWGAFPTHLDAVKHAVKAFRWQLEHHPNVIGYTAADVRRELAGKNLACWCPLDQPCHADVLLELANREEG